MTPELPSVAELVDMLNLISHPEGGFYAETYRAPAKADGRSPSTAIYFLLPRGHLSHLHRLTSDEVWHHYLGGPLVVVELTANGGARETRIGKDFARGEKPQYVVKAGTWFGSYPVDEPGGAPYALVGCTVAPGFEFADFEMGEQAALLREFPAASELIRKLS